MPILRVWDCAISQNSISYALVDFHSQVIITVKQVFTPWCFNCEGTSKQVEKLAKHYKGSSNLIFARIDASANEHPKLQVGVMKNCHLRFFFFYRQNTRTHWIILIINKIKVYVYWRWILPLLNISGEWLSNSFTLQSKW